MLSSIIIKRGKKEYEDNNLKFEIVRTSKKELISHLY